MALISGSVAFVEVAAGQAFVFLNDPTNQGPVPPGAMLWNEDGPATPTELLKRAMWLALLTRSLEHGFSVSIGSDDDGLAESVSVSGDVVATAGARHTPEEIARAVAALSTRAPRPAATG